MPLKPYWILGFARLRRRRAATRRGPRSETHLFLFRSPNHSRPSQCTAASAITQPPPGTHGVSVCMPACVCACVRVCVGACVGGVGVPVCLSTRPLPELSSAACTLSHARSQQAYRRNLLVAHTTARPRPAGGPRGTYIHIRTHPTHPQHLQSDVAATAILAATATSVKHQQATGKTRASTAECGSTFCTTTSFNGTAHTTHATLHPIFYRHAKHIHTCLRYFLLPYSE